MPRPTQLGPESAISVINLRRAANSSLANKYFRLLQFTMQNEGFLLLSGEGQDEGVFMGKFYDPPLPQGEGDL